MFSFDRFTRVATAAVGAFFLSTLSIAAAVGPAHSAGTADGGQSVHAGVQRTAAHG